MSKEPVFCNACGKNLSTPDGTELIGVQITVYNPGHLDFIVQQMYPYEVDKTYNICFPCWLHSLGVKPKHGMNILKKRR